MKHDAAFTRLHLLSGDQALRLLQRTSVILFGVGGREKSEFGSQ